MTAPGAIGACLVLISSTALVACNVEENGDPDATFPDAGFRDGGPLDVGPPDGGDASDVGIDAGDPPEDAGDTRTSCERFCDVEVPSALDAQIRLLARTEGQQPSCVVDPGGPTACVADCELNGADRGRILYVLSPYLKCWFGADRPNQSCVGTSTSPIVRIELSGRIGAPPIYSGTATVVSVDPMELEISGGLALVVDVPELPTAQLQLGEVLWISTEPACTLSCVWSLVVRDPGGELRFAVWGGDGLLPDLPELSLEYEPRACLGAPDRFYSFIDRDLMLADGTRVHPGETLVRDGFEIYNGASARYYSILATDLFDSFEAGWVVPE
jgi:hypothetical protein